MKELENDHNVSKWTKNHGISIPYYDDDKTYRQYKPDFLVEYIDGSIELVEMKSTHMLNSPNTKLKKKHAEEWCEARSMKYKLISKFQ
ncbi:MAG: Tn7 transposase TnsA N-terminal domain-containing protein [Gammaproteobacteria bacterium]|nr:Tn7 transposase TnsA N-terminal domain-containing protein [Gammaproteobacteria bacterium]